MRGIYSYNLNSTESPLSIYVRIIYNFSVVIIAFSIVFLSIFCIFITPYLDVELRPKLIFLFLAIMGTYSTVLLLVLAWMNYASLKPLTYLLNWIKKASNFETVPLPSRESIEEIHEIANLINNLISRLRETQEALIATEKDAAIGQLSAHVAHDIRSPLAALENIAASVKAFPEDDRILIRTAVIRIKDIANNLLEKNRELHSTQQEEMRAETRTKIGSTPVMATIPLLFQ